jgi:hypothetical protein
MGIAYLSETCVLHAFSDATHAFLGAAVTHVRFGSTSQRHSGVRLALPFFSSSARVSSPALSRQLASVRRRPLHGTRVISCVSTGFAAGGYTRGRQWNGKPVLDTLVLHPHSDIAQPYWSSVMETGDIVVDATCGNGWDTLFMLQSLAAAGGGTLISCDIQAVALDKARALLARDLEQLMHFDDDLALSVEDCIDVWVCRPSKVFLELHPNAGPVTLRWVLQVFSFSCPLPTEHHHAYVASSSHSRLLALILRFAVAHTRRFRPLLDLQSHLRLMERMAPNSVKVVVFNLGYLPGLVCYICMHVCPGSLVFSRLSLRLFLGRKPCTPNPQPSTVSRLPKP